MAQQFQSSDEQIENDVISAVNQQLGEDAAQVDVQVKNAIVKLTGTVEEESTRLRLFEIARGCNGVRDLESWVTVGPNQIDKHQAAINLHRSSQNQEGLKQPK